MDLKSDNIDRVTDEICKSKPKISLETWFPIHWIAVQKLMRRALASGCADPLNCRFGSEPEHEPAPSVVEPRSLSVIRLISGSDMEFNSRFQVSKNLRRS